MNIEEFYKLLQKKNYGSLFLKEPLKKYTTWRVGGPADLLYRPTKVGECADVLQLAWQHQIPVTILGVGSNVLVADQGLKGLVVLTEGFRQIVWQENLVTVGSGVLLSHLSRLAAEKGLAGLEFAAGIPGSLGGAVVMNAGAYGDSLEQVIVSVKSLDLEGKPKTYEKAELALGYRDSIFKRRKELIVEIKLALQRGNIAEIKAQMARCLNLRREKQPLEWPNAGSVFKNSGQGAGRLIEGVGAKGWRVGDAQISEKHANFIVNLGEAKASEIMTLIKEVQKAVKEKYNVDLETEVVLWGFVDNRR
ncbi:MAG TPA: UDP-N-acetylmuramate dehydrogenase [Clostridia bacterium]|jgi:UDP-N-acetylmuramate dehydrogenase|nr:UDP-N-acetylmuramate dehydrogenase [Clostridia bacterium]HHY05766.1 UDP-N-acetylmuramate dehydrogenase [Clostridia bacterium]